MHVIIIDLNSQIEHTKVACKFLDCMSKIYLKEELRGDFCPLPLQIGWNPQELYYCWSSKKYMINIELW